MTTKKEAAYLVGGVVLGAVGTKAAPNLAFVKAVKFYKEVYSAYKRLRETLRENYHLIDDAIEAEEKYLGIINPKNAFTKTSVAFEVTDDGLNRGLRMVFNALGEQ